MPSPLRILKRLRRDGLWAVLREAYRRGINYPKRACREQRRAERQGEAFDRRHGIDTWERVPNSALGLGSEDTACACPYAATAIWKFEDALAQTGVDPSRFTFVDYGSGKGLALLLASRHPFRHVVGVEYSPVLHEIAEQNLATWRRDVAPPATVEAVNLDAREFRVPDGDLFVYFYNPFDRQVMEAVLDDLEAAWRAGPRDIVVLYMNPELHDVFEGRSFLRRAFRDGMYAIYHAPKARRTHRVRRTSCASDTA